ncbi:Asp23/Gls24 family envelope stress response protein [Pseudonocardiaceae bacterium YIM PH 21723]|nr:Asp23/Gls24 family envelope stress response protein [Pseudonocardiaceae bacterium YIM PH 21723]
MSEPEDRGTLTIAPQVVRKVAEYAIGAGPKRVTVGGEHHEVDLLLQVTVDYPAPITHSVKEIGSRVRADVTRITGYHVRDLRVTVTGLRAAR